MRSDRRVVVTGLGCVSPVGLNTRQAWQALLNGQSGVTRIDRFDASDLPAQIAGLVKHFDPSSVADSKEQKAMDVFILYGLAAAKEAIEDSGLDITQGNSERIGCSIGSGIGGLSLIESMHNTLLDRGPRRISPFFIPGIIIHMVSGHVSMRYGLKGPNTASVTACATGTHSIGDAARIIAYGDADVMIAGGAEMATTKLCMSGFASARALSTRNDAPEQASRPFDADRDGFVLGEGAGVLVLEEYGHASARGARIYAEVLGFGMSGDAYHMTQPSERGEGALRCMQATLKDGAINAQQLGYINAHGTSTPAGDIAESQAIESLYAGDVSNLVVSSTKSMTGHLLGAAGGVEAVFTVMALRHQVVPPTINLERQDPECTLDYAPQYAREMSFDYAMSNSFGFGGTNASLLFGKL